MYYFYVVTSRTDELGNTYTVYSIGYNKTRVDTIKHLMNLNRQILNMIELTEEEYQELQRTV